MRNSVSSLAAVLSLCVCSLTFSQDTYRPPAVPLVTCDPYFSVWSQADRLWESPTTHWTGRSQPMAALVRVDGHAYRLMGAAPQTIAAMEQVSVTVNPTRTFYEFKGHGVVVKLTFTTPALPSDLSLLSRPTTYVNCEVSALDKQTHGVEFYFDASGELSTDQPGQLVVGSQEKFTEGVALKLGSKAQPVLSKSGDDLRIDWGYLYLAAAKSTNAVTGFGNANQMREAFDQQGSSALAKEQLTFPVEAKSVVASLAFSMGKVGSQPVSNFVVVAYDDLYSIEYMQHKLRPYWRKDGWEAQDLLTAAIKEHDSLEHRCAKFDEQLMADLKSVGGDAYARLGALAYRQCFAAGKFVADANGQPLQFSKENHSNGCIATSDVFYPMAPQFLLFGPTLTKSFLVPFMEYAASDRWRFPFAPHDLGTYPKANGQRYGGGEQNEIDQMPVEESGNLLLLFAALAQMEGNADFAGRYWKQLSTWAAYLKEKGFDPENQLCTDDFAGHMAHNVNLSAKAICALGAYAQLCERRGLKEDAKLYRQVAQDYAAKWVQAADDGDHFRLAFDQPGTWSQKYNLVWDRILQLNLFPEDMYRKEMSFYLKKQNTFGLPLDNRSDYTKLDWILWTATLTEKPQDFAALLAPVERFINQTTDRSPLTDWYYTSTARKQGFTARPVVGGVFLRMLYDQKLWQKYAQQDSTRAKDWAALPARPVVVPLVATAASDGATYQYTTTKPADNWFAPGFEDKAWFTGQGGLGTRQTPQASVDTEWSTSDIWLRREVTIKAVPARPALNIWHDEDAVIYINGQLVAELSGYTTGYEHVEIPARFLRAGENLVAIHCHQTTGGQFIDLGIDSLVVEPASK